MKKNTFILIALSLIFISCSSVPKATPKPEWVDHPENVYPDDVYISRVGEGWEKEEALADGQVELGKYFGQNVKSKVSAKENWTESSENGYSNNKSLSNEYEISFDTTFFAVEKSKPWYDVSTETWYICVYIDREEAFNIYKPTLINARKEFYNYYNEALNEADFFNQLKLLRKAHNTGAEYFGALKFAQILLPSVFNVYKQDFEDIANVDVLLTKLQNEAAVKINISKDYGTKVKDLVSKYFSDNGFNISNNNYHFVVDIDIDESRVVDEYSGIITVDPSITISMKNKSDGTVVFTYTRTFERIKSYMESSIDKKTFAAIEEELKNSFENELVEFLNK